MRKIVFPLIIALLVLASATPAFAKDKGPNGKGHAFGYGHGSAFSNTGTEVVSNPDGTETPDVEETPDAGETPEPGKGNGPKEQHGNPHVDKTGKVGNPHAGSQNFVLFGTVVGAPTADKLTVHVSSGNHVVMASFFDTDVTITLDSATVIRVMDDNPGLRAKSDAVKDGDYVRVHGWYTPAAEETETVAAEDETETTGAFWYARQVNVLTGIEEAPAAEPQG